MLSLASLLHIEGLFDSYGAAGLVLEATGVRFSDTAEAYGWVSVPVG